MSCETNLLFTGKLSQKADFRNPDEFYHKMHKARFEDGTHTVMLESGQTKKAAKLQERADLAMVQMQRQMQTKHAEKLQNNLHLIDLPRQNQSIKFISDL